MSNGEYGDPSGEALARNTAVVQLCPGNARTLWRDGHADVSFLATGGLPVPLSISDKPTVRSSLLLVLDF